VPNDTIRIKRYPNRRFYAGQLGKFLSLAEIEKMIRDGANVEIVDSASGEDIARVILIQLLTDQHPDKIALFPTPMLHAILRANNIMYSFLRDYFRNSLAYLEYFQWHGDSTPLPEPMHWMKAWMAGWPKPPGVAPEEKDESGPSPHDDRRELMERIAELEQRIAELERGRKARA
jgi:polyhydroxyalkanoate synthesis repressor PhaR